MRLLTFEQPSITAGRAVRTRTRPAADHARTRFPARVSQRELVQRSLLAIPDRVA